MYLSIKNNKITNITNPTTIADLKPMRPGNLTFEISKKFVDDIVLVSDESIIEAMKLLITRTKLFVEPAGAVGLAALISNKIKSDVSGKSVAVILSGGNYDLRMTKAIF